MNELPAQLSTRAAAYILPAPDLQMDRCTPWVAEGMLNSNVDSWNACSLTQLEERW